MKRLMIIMIALIFIGCDKDDDICTCTLEVTADGDGSYFIVGVPTDCDGNVLERPYNVNPEHFLLGCVD